MFQPDLTPRTPDKRYEIREALARTARITPQLFFQTIDEVGGRCRSQDSAAPAAPSRLQRLVDARAWADAALELVAELLPAWAVRHLSCEDGLWHCVLSQQPSLPDWLDDSVEGCGADLPIAVLDALVQASRMRCDDPGASDRGTPRDLPVLTDDFC